MLKKIKTKQKQNKNIQSVKVQCSLESLKYGVAQFLWYSWVSFTYEFTSSKKTHFERDSFLTKTVKRRTMKSKISKQPAIHKN